MALGDEIFRGYNMKGAKAHGATPASSQNFGTLKPWQVVKKFGGYNTVYGSISSKYPDYVDAFNAKWGGFDEGTAQRKLQNMMFDYYYGYAGNQGETYLYFDMGNFQKSMDEIYKSLSSRKKWKATSQRGPARRSTILTSAQGARGEPELAISGLTSQLGR